MTLETLPSDVKNIFFDNWQTVCTNTLSNPTLNTFILFHPHTQSSTTNWSALLNPVVESQTTQFKLIYSYHLILRHRKTNELLLFHAPYNNVYVLDNQPLLAARHIWFFSDRTNRHFILDTTNTYSSYRRTRQLMNTTKTIAVFPPIVWLYIKVPSSIVLTNKQRFSRPMG